MPDDPYVYRGTSTLRNLRDIRDADALRTFETRASFARIRELQERPLVEEFDRAHLHAIHRHIFQDVYEWAGQVRTVEIAKLGSPFFAFKRFVDSSLDTLTAQLKAEGYLRGLSAEDFAIRAGHYLGEVNAIHPFREGNGRTQQEFVRKLALQAGYRIAWANVSRKQMYAASKVSYERADSSGLAAVIDIAINSPHSKRAALRAALAVERDRSTIAADAAAVLAARDPTSRIVEDGLGNREVKGEVIATSALHAAIATSTTSFVIVDRSSLDAARSRAQDDIKLRADIGEPMKPPPLRRL